MVYLRIQESQAGARVVEAYVYSNLSIIIGTKKKKTNKEVLNLRLTCVQTSFMVPPFPTGNIIKTSRPQQSQNQDG